MSIWCSTTGRIFRSPRFRAWRLVACASDRPGKLFSLTGWKVGWVTGPTELVRVVANAHQFITFTTSPALQLGIAYALEHEMDSSRST